MPPPPGGRVGWLDGLRGLAAIQVLLLHVVTAFTPALSLMDPNVPRRPWQDAITNSPLFFIYNGYAAVDLFFLMSGAALTFAFSRAPYAGLRWTMRRLIRLGLPMAGAILLGYGLLCLFPTAHLNAAARIADSEWLRDLMPESPRWTMALHQILLEGMITGYQATSLLPVGLVRFLGVVEVTESFDPPLSTLHTEFIGSLLIIALVAARSRLPRLAHLGLCVMLAIWTANSPLVLFILGHLAAPALLRADRAPSRRPAGIACLGIGIMLCTGRSLPGVITVWSILPPPPLGWPLDPYNFQLMLGTTLILAGVTLLPGLRHWLSQPAGQLAGKLSFSLYLVHMPVLFTLGCTLFLWLHPLLPEAAALAISALAAIAGSGVTAVLFERWIDRPAIRLSQRVGRITGPGTPASASPGRSGSLP